MLPLTYHNFYLMGQYQAHGYYEETDPEIPYSVPNIGYKITKVIDNDKLISDELCESQAQYETYNTTVKQDSVSLKIRYTLLSTGETAEWVIRNLSWSSQNATMSVTLYRFVEDYKDYWDRKQENG